MYMYDIVFQPSVVFGDPSVHPRNHTASLDFDRDDEILHYPFFVRRARSLDQEIDTRCRIQNRFGYMLFCHFGYTINFLNIQTPQKVVVIILKFELCGSTIE